MRAFLRKIRAVKNIFKNSEGLAAEVLKRRQAETLIEVIAAVSILMVVLAPMTGLFTQTIRISGYDKNTLVAAGLANSGIELAVNIRDSNLMKYASEDNKCWNTKPEYKPADLNECGEDANKIAAGSYRLAINPQTFLWDFAQASAPLSDGLTDPDTDFFFQLLLAPEDQNIGDPYNYSTGSSTNFFREISVEYPQNLPSKNLMLITSKVLFKSGVSISRIQRKVVLTSTGP